MNDNITEINKDSFWKLIQSAKETCGQDMDAMMAFLKDWLVSMGPEQAQNFHDILHAYEDLADKFGLWDAAGVCRIGVKKYDFTASSLTCPRGNGKQFCRK